MKTWLILQTLLLEFASLYILGFEQFDTVQWLSYASTHMLAALSFTLLCWLVLPMHFKVPVWSAMLFILVIAFSMPVIGMMGLATIFIVALYFPKAKEQQLWRRSEALELPVHPESLAEQQFGSAALKDILLFNPSFERRLIAVNACQYLPVREAVSLLKIALTDKVDDVRLLAYAAIEKNELKINEQIDQLKNALKRTDDAATNFQIAVLYWELCYLGIADGPLKLHYLNQAKAFLLKSEQRTPSTRSQLQLGRVLLELQEYEQAMHYLELAHKGGLLMKQVAPYLAEAAFAMGDYDHAALLMKHLPVRPGEPLYEQREFWRREAH